MKMESMEANKDVRGRRASKIDLEGQGYKIGRRATIEEKSQKDKQAKAAYSRSEAHLLSTETPNATNASAATKQLHTHESTRVC